LAVEGIMTSKVDKEVEAMQASLGALSGLEPGEQKRVLEWLGEKLNLGNVSVLSRGSGDQRSGLHIPTPAAVGGTPAAKTFMVEKRPSTDVERVTCLAYYLTHYRDTPQFKSKQLAELNKEAAQPKFSNTAVAVKNATVQNQYLSPAAEGNKQITARGEAIVEGLPDQEKVKAALQAIPLRGYRKAKKSGARPGKSAGTRKSQ
jgi:hypothetical protein